MRRTETLVALLAVILGSLAALPIHGRFLFAIAAIALILGVGMSRMRAAMLERKSYTPFAAERARRIREDRERRLRRL